MLNLLYDAICVVVDVFVQLSQRWRNIYISIVWREIVDNVWKSVSTAPALQFVQQLTVTRATTLYDVIISDEIQHSKLCRQILSLPHPRFNPHPDSMPHI